MFSDYLHMSVQRTFLHDDQLYPGAGQIYVQETVPTFCICQQVHLKHIKDKFSAFPDRLRHMCQDKLLLRLFVSNSFHPCTRRMILGSDLRQWLYFQSKRVWNDIEMAE